jgi:hypothetical protein
MTYGSGSECTCGNCGADISQPELDKAFSLFRMVLADAYEMYDGQLDTKDESFTRIWFFGVLSGAAAAAPIAATLGEDGLELVLAKLFASEELRPPVGRT